METNAPSSIELPEIVIRCTSLWQQLLALAAQVDSSHAAIEEQWAPYRSGQWDRLLRTPDFSDALKDARSSITHKIVDFAIAQFSPKGARLEVGYEDLKDATHSKEIQQFDPATVWKWLVERYGGSAGEQEAWRQAAAILKRILLRECGFRDVSPKARGQCMVFEMMAWPDPYSSTPAGSLRYGTGTIEHMMELVLKGLVPLFAHEMAQDGIYGAVPANLNCYANRLHTARHNNHFVSREKVTTGPVTFIHYSKKIEVVLTLDAFERLNLFVASYLALPVTKAA